MNISIRFLTICIFAILELKGSAKTFNQFYVTQVMTSRDHTKIILSCSSKEAKISNQLDKGFNYVWSLAKEKICDARDALNLGRCRIPKRKYNHCRVSSPSIILELPQYHFNYSGILSTLLTAYSGQNKLSVTATGKNIDAVELESF